jgi:CRISPR type I-E-associated protein CasB/Cse2
VTQTNSTESGAAPPQSTYPALAWWRRLRDPHRGDPGALARLRRSRSTLEAMQVPAALELAKRLGAMPRNVHASGWMVRAALDLARVLARVREHDPVHHPMRAAGWKQFAGSRRESDAGKDRPVLSEARFRRLLLTADGEEKVSAFTRLIALLGGNVKVDDLSRDFMRWNHPEFGDRVRERWAFLYYAAGTAAPLLPAEAETPTEDEDV